MKKGMCSLSSVERCGAVRCVGVGLVSRCNRQGSDHGDVQPWEISCSWGGGSLQCSAAVVQTKSRRLEIEAVATD